MRQIKWAIAFVASVAVAIMAGCAGFGVHRIDVQQGNLITQEQLGKVKTGMSRNEVKGLLGTPLLQDVFHANRWDYYFSNEQGTQYGPFGREQQKFQVTVFFEQEKVAKIDGIASPVEILTGGGPRRFLPNTQVPGAPTPPKQ